MTVMRMYPFTLGYTSHFEKETFEGKNEYNCTRLHMLKKFDNSAALKT